MELVAGEYRLLELSQKNVILGKNGCGKSFLLKHIQQGANRGHSIGQIRYISPERGGILQYEPNVEQNIGSNPSWLQDTRRQNQAGNFRQQSATLFRRLELLVLREIEQDRTKPSFGDTIDKLNVLLERVRIERDNVKAFRIVVRETDSETPPQELSSGESELISLGIEILSFVREAEVGKENVLFVDEPDVHLHPDLQDRLAQFIIGALAGQPVTLVIATHSTPLLSGLAKDPDTRLAFKRRGQHSLTFKPVSEVDRTILPIFGAHPLSNVFNQAPVLIVEGDDDARVWQQVVRSSDGRFRIFPCVAGSKDVFSDFEAEVNNVIEAVYDDAQAFSLRDRDTDPEVIEDLGHISRMRLSCRTAENLMLSNEVLHAAGKDWVGLQATITQWAQANPGHLYHAEVQAFIDSDFDRRGHDLKDIRNILLGLFSNKPWEVLVGKAIAQLVISGGEDVEGSLQNFLGEKVSAKLLKLTTEP